MNTLKSLSQTQLRAGSGVASIRPVGEVRMLRLPAVKQMTGLGKTKIYELQAAGDFPMRVQLTTHCVGWVEQDVQAWLSRRVEGSRSLSER